MSALKPLAAKGKGNVAVILPDTVSSARYVEFDAPYLTEALTKAGLRPRSSPCRTRRAATPPVHDAQTAITKGATVLVVDPLDSGVGAHIESYAKAHGVAVIDYDRLTLGGSRKYYVSFNNVMVGTLIGQGLVACVSAWKSQEAAGHRHEGRAPPTTTRPCSPRATTRCSPRSAPAGRT